MHHVFTLQVDWDGRILRARTTTNDGWRYLADRAPVKHPGHSVHCDEVGELSPFDFGLFLATACRDFTNEWEIAYAEQLRSAALFELLPGERD